MSLKVHDLLDMYIGTENNPLSVAGLVFHKDEEPQCILKIWIVVLKKYQMDQKWEILCAWWKEIQFNQKKQQSWTAGVGWLLCINSASGNMICQKMRNTVCLVERNPMQPEKAGNCSVRLRLLEGEEGGRVARFQSPTKVVLAQFWIFLATHWTFLSTFWGFFWFWQCTGAGDLLLTSGKD